MAYSKYAESRWGGNVLVDDTALLLSGDGERCNSCRMVIRNEFLEAGLCPDCYQVKHGEKSPALSIPPF